MFNIPLSRGLSTIVDDGIGDEIKFKKWYADKGNKEKTKYYATSYTREGGKKVKIYLHRIIVGAKKGQYVDHINGDTLDNRGENLRICSPSENQMNRNVVSKNFSGHKGVSYERKSGLWTARIKMGGKSNWLGRFALKDDAINAYAAASRELFGDFCPTEIRSLGAAS